MNLISVPMQYDFNILNEIIEMNSSDRYKNCMISSFFGSLTQGAEEALGFENYRDASSQKDIQTISDMAQYVRYAQLNGIEFQYCINAAKTLTSEELYLSESKIKRFCETLLNNGITILKIGNLLLFDYIHCYFGDAFKYYLSTTKEYSGIMQYQRLIHQHPEIEEICLPTDLNKNRLFIENLQKVLPNLRIEIMVNEGCIYACPWRKDHTPHSSDTHVGILRRLMEEGNIDMPNRMLYYYVESCAKCRQDAVFNAFIRKTIMPWEIPEYNKIGINRFKFAGRDMLRGYMINTLKVFLRGITDYDAIKDLPWDFFNNYHYNTPSDYISIDKMKEYYPKIDYFFNKKGSCADTCGSTCTYCNQCADNAIEHFGIDNLVNRRKPTVE